MEILKQLIAISSISGNEKRILNFIFNYLVKLELNPCFIGENVTVHIKGHNRKKAIIFNAHIDTVCAGDLNNWKDNPFKPTIYNNKIFGLGASDEKAASAVLLVLAEKYKQEKPECDVWMMFVSNEELDGSGTKEVLKWFKKKHLNKYDKCVGVLGEPTNLKTIEIGHKGNIFLKITLKGDSGHGSRPDKIKKHAIFEMYRLFGGIKKLNDIVVKKYSNELLGNPTISVTAITAGDIGSPNKFADSCSVSLDIRTTPEFHSRTLKLIKDYLKNCEVKLISESAPPGYTNPREEIVMIVKELTECKIDVSDGSNDLCFFSELTIPAVVFGPGAKECIHQPNEYCELENIDKCIRIYKEIVNKYSN